MTTLQIVLGILLVYHLGIGAVSVASEQATVRFSNWFYGTSLTMDAQAVYMLKALGMYALFTAAVIGITLSDLARFWPLAYAVAGLQAIRAASRLLFFGVLSRGLQVPAGRNQLNATLLIIEAALLIAATPPVGVLP